MVPFYVVGREGRERGREGGVRMRAEQAL